MSIKGYPTTQKLTNNQASRNDFVTLQPMDSALRQGIDVISRFAYRVGGNTPRVAGANTGNPSDGSGTVVADTSTPAKVGDFVRFVTGQASFLELPIIEVSTNSFKLGAFLVSTLVPSATDTFFIMRYATQRVDEDGTQLVTASQGPVQFVLDSVDTEVEEDTGTPANSKPLPVKILKDAINANGSNVNSAVSTVATITAPANAIGFILMNLDTSTTSFRWRIGAVATASSGQQMQPGRDTGYIPCGANISICAESGTCNYNIQWILSA